MRRVILPHHISADPAPAAGVLHDFAGRSMGTSWSVRLVAAPTAATSHLQQGLQQQLDAVVAEMSHWEADSDLGRYNRAPAGSWQVLPAAFFDVLAFALDVARASGGACDPCAGTLVNLWGFGPHGRFGRADFSAPTAAAVAAARDRLAAVRHAVALAPPSAADPQRRAFQPGGIALDLSAVAKGYGVDRLAYYLKSQGHAHYVVEVGGELRGAGVKPDGQPWWVALEQVDSDNDEQQTVVALHGLAVATSGDYRRYFERDGVRYSHTIDPRSGMPVANGLASVTVIHAQCMAADAWSTALTVLGRKEGLALAERLGLAARFVERTAADGVAGARPTYTEYLSSHLRGMLDA
ncbi:thiamine biosynthesis protein ApbE [Duganella sp. Leaf126]|uniref:FAD:protein FMN transferase n=1 Tax=Duganella sp. Leaf126 TaxID=1736266 RepID=UPI0006FB8ADF|nr:FAD:protein FMN transferase [Duganella sp. Leaf126]KQQ33314.1 thiamine biosynthesis protein ApbE [Duganella sp. Leaf126]